MTMSISEIMDHIHKIEQMIPVEKWAYRGIDLWPILRCKLYFDLFIAHNFPASTSIQKTAKVAKRVKQLLVLLPDLIRTLRYAIHSKFDVVFLADASYISWEGKRYHRFIDPEIEWLSQKNINAVTLSQTSADNSALTNLTLNISSIDLLIRLIAACHVQLSRSYYQPEKLEVYNEYLISLGMEAISLKSLNYTASIYWLMSKFYQAVLKKFSPKAAFVVSYYERWNMAFIHACRELGIPVTDIQHGAINSYHACYGGWSNMPSNGFNTLPDYFFCWDQKSADCINDWATKAKDRHFPIIHGNRFMKKVVSQPNHFKEIFSSTQNTKKPAFNVLLTIQTDYEVTPFINSMLRQAPQSYFWWIRLHPMFNNQQKDKIKLLLSGIPNLQHETDFATECSLYEILPLMDSHITLNSSVVVEASQMGIPSIVCEDTGHAYYEEFFKSGDAYVALTPDEAIKLVEKVSKNPRKLEFPSPDQSYSIIGIHVPSLKDRF